MDKLGYMPKIDVQVGEVDLKIEDTWPFPVPAEKRKPVVKKATTRAKKLAVAAKTPRTKKK